MLHWRVLLPHWQLSAALLRSSQHTYAVISSAAQLRQVHILQQALLQQHQHQQEQLQQQWPQQACMAAFSTLAESSPRMPTKHERRVAHLKFCQERSLWRAQLKQLRKHWMLQHQQKVAAHRAAVAESKRQIEQLRELRSEHKKEDHERHTLEKEVQQAVQEVQVAARRLESAYRQSLREATLQRVKDQRHSMLLSQSSSWIPPDKFEARIAEALANPKPL